MLRGDLWTWAKKTTNEKEKGNDERDPDEGNLTIKTSFQENVAKTILQRFFVPFRKSGFSEPSQKDSFFEFFSC